MMTLKVSLTEHYSPLQRSSKIGHPLSVMLLSTDISFHIPWHSCSLSCSVNDTRCRMWRTPIFSFQQQLWKKTYNMLNAPISECGKIVQSLSAHARDHLIVLELILILFSNILGLSWSEWCNKPAVGLLHPEYAIAKASTQNQLSFHLFVGCPSDDLTGENKSKSQESTHTPLLRGINVKLQMSAML